MTECPDCGATNTQVVGFHCDHQRCPIFATEPVHLGILDDMEHEAKLASEAKIIAEPEQRRKAELRIQALGAAISRRDWHATEQAYAAIRDKFYEAAPR